MDQDGYEFKMILPREEVARLRELAGAFNQEPEDLVAGFIADLTNSERANGEDEHKAAYGWWRTVYRNWG